MSYEKFKSFLAEHKNELWLLACFVVVYLAGVGTGKAIQPPRKAAQQANMLNYTTNKPTPAQDVKAQEAPAAATPEPTVLGQTQTGPAQQPTPAPTGPCLIKGNIASSGKIYHVQGGSFYARVKPEQCFATEAEAIAAGFRKSKN